MENEKKDQNGKNAYGKQVFFFNDEGKLIVKTNNGLWVDGEQYVKMYGNFTCNAKTLGIIINKFNGCPVVVKDIRQCGSMNIPFVVESIVNPTEDDNLLMDEIKRVCERNNKLVDEINDRRTHANKEYREAIEDYNRLPWWKRMFKKIEVK